MDPEYFVHCKSLILDSLAGTLGCSKLREKEGRPSLAMGFKHLVAIFVGTIAAAQNDVDFWNVERPRDMANIKSLDVMCGKTHMEVQISFDRPYNGIIFSKGAVDQYNCIYVKPQTGANAYSFNIMYDQVSFDQMTICSLLEFLLVVTLRSLLSLSGDHIRTVSRTDGQPWARDRKLIGFSAQRRTPLKPESRSTLLNQLS